MMKSSTTRYLGAASERCLTLMLHAALGIALYSALFSASGQQAFELPRHATGAPCWSSGSRTHEPELQHGLRDSLTEEFLVEHSFRVWFLAQLMRVIEISIETQRT